MSALVLRNLIGFDHLIGCWQEIVAFHRASCRESISRYSSEAGSLMKSDALTSTKYTAEFTCVRCGLSARLIFRKHWAITRYFERKSQTLRSKEDGQHESI